MTQSKGSVQRTSTSHATTVFLFCVLVTTICNSMVHVRRPNSFKFIAQQKAQPTVTVPASSFQRERVTKQNEAREQQVVALARHQRRRRRRPRSYDYYSYNDDEPEYEIGNSYDDGGENTFKDVFSMLLCRREHKERNLKDIITRHKLAHLVEVDKLNSSGNMFGGLLQSFAPLLGLFAGAFFVSLVKSKSTG